jgi:two-component system response regulator PilR (NtrC family)
MSARATILVVDDEPEIRDMLSRHYRLLGDTVVTAGDVDEAERALAQRRFDVVLCDIMMPGRLGTELLTTIRNEYPMTHAIMITGYVTMENAMSCMRRGADTCVFKPLTDLTELDQAVERAVSDIRRWTAKLSTLRAMSPKARAKAKVHG